MEQEMGEKDVKANSGVERQGWLTWQDVAVYTNPLQGSRSSDATSLHFCLIVTMLDNV